MPKQLSHARLLEVLDYNPATGVFIARVKRYEIQVGQVCGWIGKNGYVYIGIDGGQYLGHRLAWFYVYGTWPKKTLDHENHVVSDNRLSNLRPATHKQNCRNVNIGLANTSGFKGVSLKRGRSNYVAQIMCDQKNHYLGVYSDPKDAARVYDKAALRMFGRFAKTNASMGLL